jgi:Asp-tRNA(Asn)/Glu-tRNA(Gln) amidotransferase A subunit family amidase
MSTDHSVHAYTVSQYREMLVSGQVDLADFYQQQLAYAQAADERLHLFANLDEQVIRLQADHLVLQRGRGEPAGKLFGVPVAVKDIIDTIDFPTGCGSPLHEARYSVADATVVRRLRGQGAVIFGKTVTTEFATMHPGPTCNPHNPAHTPGGSSSGSAAAVAAGVVPVALGTQTNGSVLRPASFCGVYGFKPSMGELPRSGIFEQSPSLDQVGLFARCIDDLALVGEIMTGDDGADEACRGRAPRSWLATATSAPPLPPRFCFVRTPWWGQMDPEAQEACEAFLELMEGVVDVVDLPATVEQTVRWLATVNDAELAQALYFEYHHHADALSPTLRQRLAQAHQITATDYLLARTRMPHVACAFDEFFDRYDAILSPAALGAAPAGLASTGNPIMQTVWTFAGLPALSLPLLQLSGNMPFGIQAVGPHLHDARLLRASRWLVQEFDQRSSS